MTTRLRTAILVLAWIVLTPIAIIAPGTPAQAAELPAVGSWLADSGFERVSAGSVAGSSSGFAAAAEIDCDSIVWQGSPACTGPNPAAGPAAPETDPCILYANTPACPNPPADADDDEDEEDEPDPLVIEAEARGKAEALLEDALKNPGWGMDPSPDEDHPQVVGLDSYMYTDISWNTSVERQADAGPDGHVVEVTMTAKPLDAVWTFDELGPQGRADTTLDCPSGGNKWDDSNPTPLCPRIWDHSSDVTGDVEITFEVDYEVSWTSDLGNSGTLGPWTIASDTTKTVTVAEVLTFGWSPKNNHDDGGGCGGFWGWACKVAKIALDLALEAVYLLAPWIEPFVDFLKGCSDAVIEQLGGLVDIAKEVYNAVTDTEAFIDEKVQLIKEMWAAANEDLDGFITEMLKGFVDADYFEEHGAVAGVSKLLCNFAIEYLTGKAAVGLAAKLEDFIGRKRDKNGELCPISSFPGDTLVLMGDGTHRRIDSIRPGDHVLSHNLATGDWETKLVVDQWSHLDEGPAATLRLTDESDVTATDDHLFWVENTQRWTELQWLKAGDQLLTPSGTEAVDSVTVGPRHDWRVWELTVADNHNFTVLAGGHAVLVHNEGDAHDWSVEADPKVYQNEWNALSPAQQQAALDALPDKPAGTTWKQYYDSLSVGEVRTLMAGNENGNTRNNLKAGLRRPGGLHEFFPVALAVKAKMLGLTSADISAFTIPTGDFEGVDQNGDQFGHNNNSASSRYHNDLMRAILAADSLEGVLQAIKNVNTDWGIRNRNGDPLNYPDDEDWQERDRTRERGCL